MQTVLLPLKKVPGKLDKNFKRPQARANGAAQGQPDRPKPSSGEPGIERCAASAQNHCCLSEHCHAFSEIDHPQSSVPTRWRVPGESFSPAAQPGSTLLPRVVRAGCLCRLEAQVLCGQLWHKECKESNNDLPETVPLSFPSADAYLKTFEPLLFEEARESLLGDWVEACEGPRARVWAAHITRYTSCCTIALLGLDSANGHTRPVLRMIIP